MNVTSTHLRDNNFLGSVLIGKKPARRYTVSIAGAEAGAFWSGAMRCPKCRADMEQVEYEGTEIDRCNICKGMWFDAGEIEALRDKKAAAAIDTGDACRDFEHEGAANEARFKC